MEIKSNTITVPLNILLAEDDTEDCMFFYSVIKEIPIATHLTTIHDGEHLMNYLFKNSENLPDVLFLDLGMPRKSGFECLPEIKENQKLKDIFVAIFTIPYKRGINFEHDMRNMLLKTGADDYIIKSFDFEQLKAGIHNALKRAIEKKLKYTPTT